MALPGVIVTVNDGGLKVQRPASGPKITLLGTTTSTDLSINEPTIVVDVTKALQATRNAPDANGIRTESELSLGLADALNGGGQIIELVKIGTGNLSLDGLEYSGISTFARYNALSGAYDALKAVPTDIVVPLGVYAEDLIGTGYVTSIGLWTGGTNTDSFVRQLAQFNYQQTVNHNTSIGVIGVKPPCLAPCIGSKITGSYIATGDDGYWFGTPSLSAISNWVNYLLGTGASMVNAGWLNYLSGSTSNYVSFYMTTSAFQGVDINGVGQTDDLGNKIDAGAYVNVFAAPVRSLAAAVRKFASEKGASLTNTSINISGAAAYAGLIASLQPHSGTTNKSVPGLIAARRLSTAQADSLLTYRMTTMLERARGFVVVQGVTGAYKVDDYTKSDFTQLTTVRITQAAIDQVRLACEPYIGEAMNAANMNAMRESIESGLRSMKLVGALNRYLFNILATPDQQVLGQASVDLTIVPAFELIKVNVSVKLAKQ